MGREKGTGQRMDEIFGSEKRTLLDRIHHYPDTLFWKIPRDLRKDKTLYPKIPMPCTDASPEFIISYDS